MTRKHFLIAVFGTLVSSIGALFGIKVPSKPIVGKSVLDAGYFYCPYVPLVMTRAVNVNSFQPKINFRTRSGSVQHRNYSYDRVTG